MMKHIAAFATAIILFVAPATAQSAAQISKVQKGQSCAGCNLFQADLAYRDGSDMNLSGARLRQANMSLSTYNSANFSKANMSVTNLFGARFNRSNFANANLSNAAAVGTYFGSSDMSGANLSGANLSGADLSIARGLTQSQLNKSCGDNTTRLPAGKHIPRCR